MIPKSKKIAYFNCTATQPHIGCYAVTDAHFRMLLGNGYEIIHIAPLNALSKYIGTTKEETIHNLEQSYVIDIIKKADAIIINGEGTIHHNQGQDLLCLAEVSRKLNTYVFLVNAVIESLEGYDEILNNLTDLNVREINSSNFLKNKGINHRIVLDSILEANFNGDKKLDFKDKIILTDWHIKRDADVGRKILEFERKYRKDIVFFPLHHLYHLQNDNWRGIIESLSEAKVIITGRHHGVYLAGLAGIPIVAMPSNTYKVEGTLKMFSEEISFCDTDDNLEEKMDYAINNPKIAKNFQAFLREQKPLATFDKLYELLPSVRQLCDREIDERVELIFNDLTVKTSEKELFSTYGSLQLRVHQSHRVELLINKEERLVNRISVLDDRIVQLGNIRSRVEDNYKDLREKFINLKNIANQNQTQAREQIKIRSEKIVELNETVKLLKIENKILLNTQKNIGKNLFVSRDYIHCREILFQIVVQSPCEFPYIIMLCRAEEYLYTANNIKPTYIKQFIKNIQALPESNDIYRAFATAFYYSYDYNNAKEYIEKLILLKDKNHYTYQFWLANCLRFNGEILKVENIYIQLINSDFEKKLDVYINIISLYNQTSQFKKAKEILKIIYTDIENTIEYNKDYLYYLSENNLSKAWTLFADNGIKKNIEIHYNGEENFNEIVEKNNFMNTLVIIPYGGIGDEIRMSNLYLELVSKYDKNIGQIIIACDYRIKNILSRTYPECKFISINHNIDEKNNVPKELVNYMNHNLSMEAQKADCVVVNMSLLKFFRKNYQSFYNARNRKLIIDPLKKDKWKKKLQHINKNKIKIGINQGTHLHTYIRNPNIFNYTLWEKIFNIKDIEFVNLSFSMTDEEINSCNNQYNMNIHHFPEEDLKNDIENLAALISEMDIVITPTNMIVDLAGSLGVKTFCIFTTSDYNWRFKDNYQDVWHKSVLGVRADNFMDKNTLMLNLFTALKKLLTEKK